MADKMAEIIVPDQIHLAHWHEAAQSLDSQFEAADVAPRDAGLDHVPDLQAHQVGHDLGLAERQPHQPRLAIESLRHELKRLARLRRLVWRKLIQGDDALALAADVHKHIGPRDTYDPPDDAALGIGLGLMGRSGRHVPVHFLGHKVGRLLDFAVELRLIQLVGIDRHVAPFISLHRQLHRRFIVPRLSGNTNRFFQRGSGVLQGANRSRPAARGKVRPSARPCAPAMTCEAVPARV